MKLSEQSSTDLLHVQNEGFRKYLETSKTQSFQILFLQAVLSSVLAGASASYVGGYGLGAVNGGLVLNGAGYAHAAVAAPAYAAVPVAAPVATQYRAQDELGNVNYGYSNINSARQEVGNAYAGVTGAYSYVDPNGVVQSVKYVADGAGFRVLGATNLPVAPVDTGVPPVDTGVAPEPVQDTPEVAAAKAEHLAAVAAAGHKKKRSLGYARAPVRVLPALVKKPVLLARPYKAVVARPAYVAKPAYVARPVVLRKKIIHG